MPTMMETMVMMTGRRSLAMLSLSPLCAIVSSVDVTISVAANCVIGIVVNLADKHRVGQQM